MKKTRVMSLIAAIFFSGSLLSFIIYEAVKIVAVATQQTYFAPYFPSYFDIAVFAGAALLLVGVLLARNGRARWLYPIGFLLLIIPHAVSVSKSFGLYGTSLYLSVIAAAAALCLLAADAFVLPRMKVIGIIGAALLWSVMFYPFAATAVDAIRYFPFTNTQPLWTAGKLLYYFVFMYVAAGGLLYAIGRQPRHN